nr:ATP-binding protein [uncultured Gemmiger sp.]
MGDPARINQILNNLLSNAFKFTPEGGTIRLSVTQIDKGDFAKYKIVVADTGIGMSADFLPHLFEPYSREMRFTAKQSIGTGLGMSITKNLVSQMNGEMHVESEQGKGTTFTLVLPFAVVAGQEAEAASPTPECYHLDGRHVLLAEDNEVNMEITTELLQMNGAVVTQAWNGREALEQFEKSKTFYFDAILLDMQMPEMDGCEAARRIRALPRPDAPVVPIIAVTANAFAEDIAATAAAGMNAHVSKPIDFGLLCRTLGRLTSDSDGLTAEQPSQGDLSAPQTT